MSTLCGKTGDVELFVDQQIGGAVLRKGFFVEESRKSLKRRGGTESAK